MLAIIVLAVRTYLYKLTSDRGGAPCAPPPMGNDDPLLTLSICKPAIRRTAVPGDRILGITSRALSIREGYAPNAVIYAAYVERSADPREYYAEASAFTSRPDCIYQFHQENGRLLHSGRTRLHADPAYQDRDIGRYPFYRNARTLVSKNFRYFGAEAIPITARFPLLLHVSEALGQGHRVFEQTAPEAGELNALFKLLWRKPTRFTPASVEEEAPGHAPRGKTLS